MTAALASRAGGARLPSLPALPASAEDPLATADPLRCPHCGTPLGALDPRTEHPCTQRPLQPAGSRVLDVARASHYWNHLDPAQMEELLRDAEDRGWREALDTHLAPRVDAYTLAYATDARRADWYPLCDLPARPRVLDIGAGWGAVAIALARQGAEVLALDSTRETLEFVALRAGQEGVGDRVRCVRIDALEQAALPLADGWADLVVMNGVLEWVGPAAPAHTSPRDAQLAVLREVGRSLAPTGQFYLAIESRWSLAALAGAQDHPGTRWTSVLPRPLASLVTRRAGQGPYRTWTYGYRGLRRLLREGGFGEAGFWTGIPDYRFPDLLVPIDDGAAFRATIDRPGVSPRFARLLSRLSRLGLHRDAVAHFHVVARP